MNEIKSTKRQNGELWMINLRQKEVRWKNLHNLIVFDIKKTLLLAAKNDKSKIYYCH